MKHPYIVAVCICAMLGVVGCQAYLPMDLSRITGGKLSDEEKIALILDDVQRGIEGRRVYQVLAHVSRSYRDREGRDYAALSADLNSLLRNYRNIRITRTPPNINVRGDRARVIDTFGTTADPLDALAFPAINLQGQVIIMMDRFGDVWQIVEWGPVT